MAQAGSKDYRDMTDSEIKEAVKQIVITSSSEDEVRSRVADELGYPYGISMHTHVPEGDVGMEGKEILEGLGGLVLKNGAMVMVMIHGHNGTISL